MAVGESDPYFWLGYLSAALKIIARDNPGFVGREAIRAVREYESSPVLSRETVAFAVLDAEEECYAIRGTREEADLALQHAGEHLYGAATCGHPSASAWVDARLPLAVVTVTEEERIEMLENGTPVLDREP